MLTWLRDQVLALWSRVSSILSSAYAYARDRAASALESAKGWARSAIDAAAAVLSTAIAAARSLAVSLYNSAVALARALEVGVRVALNLGLEAVRSFARTLHTAALAAIETAKVFLRVLVNLTAEQVRAWVTALFGGMLAWFNAWKLGLEQILKWFQTEFPAGWQFLKGLMGLLSAANLQALADLLGRMYKWLVGFLADPLGYIAAFVMSFFIPMLCDLIAHGMGTVKYDLPPMRTYHGSAVGDYVPGGPGPPPGASGLAPPLSGLYVSGYRYGPTHHGLDLGLKDGQAVYAMHDGRVIAAGWSDVGYGNMVVIEGGGWWSRYGHCKALGVQKGDSVGQSQQIANGDSTGNSSGPHLHLELKYNGNWVDPATVLGV